MIPAQAQDPAAPAVSPAPCRSNGKPRPWVPNVSRRMAGYGIICPCTAEGWLRDVRVCRKDRLYHYVLDPDPGVVEAIRKGGLLPLSHVESYGRSRLKALTKPPACGRLSERLSGLAGIQPCSSPMFHRSSRTRATSPCSPIGWRFNRAQSIQLASALRPDPAAARATPLVRRRRPMAENSGSSHRSPLMVQIEADLAAPDSPSRTVIPEAGTSSFRRVLSPDGAPALGWDGRVRCGLRDPFGRGKRSCGKSWCWSSP